MTLEWTGERLVPGLSGTPLYYEHAHRYACAAGLAPGRTVLDVGSGEGYGAAVLAHGARRVVGIDIAPDAIAHARKTYSHLPNLWFGVADAERLPVPSQSMDLVTCFEVIEHVEHPTRLLDEVRRALRPDGVFVVSTPDKAAYATSRHNEPNEFHLSEMHLQEFEEAMAERFSTVAIMGQRLVGWSVMWPLATDLVERPAEVVTVSRRGEQVTLTLRDAVPVLYAVAVCTNHHDGLPPLRASFFVDLDAPLFDETHERMEDAQRQLGAVAAELERLQGEAVERQAEVEDQRRLAEAHRQEAERVRLELEAERATIGGALLARYRAAIDRLAPAGSTRRRAYLLVPRTVRSAYRSVRGRGSAEGGGTGSSTDAP